MWIGHAKASYFFESQHSIVEWKQKNQWGKKKKKEESYRKTKKKKKVTTESNVYGKEYIWATKNKSTLEVKNMK